MTSLRVIPNKIGIDKIPATVIPDLIGNLYKSIPISLFVFLALIFSPLVLADAKTDYDYQYGQYRTNYAEFAILKQDYINTPSLDNQQKVMISAKQTILSRDLAKASLDWFLLDLINGYRVDYAPIKPVIDALGTSRQYFLDQSLKSQAIVTEADLKKFTANYLETVPENDAMMKFGILANKIANLVRIQIDSKAALESIIPKLPSPMPQNLTERIQELRDKAKFIDAKIDTFAYNLPLVDAVSESANDIFFSARVEILAEIRTLQLDWINRLIDIDINYVQPQI